MVWNGIVKLQQLIVLFEVFFVVLAGANLSFNIRIMFVKGLKKPRDLISCTQVPPVLLRCHPIRGFIFCIELWGFSWLCASLCAPFVVKEFIQFIS